MATKSDPVLVEAQRVYDEYQAAREGVVGNDSPDPFARARFDRAQQALREFRQMLRQVGQFVGDRPVAAEGSDVPDHAVVGIRSADNEAAAPVLLEV